MKKVNSQKEAVLNHLKTIGSLTSYEAFLEYGITRLSAIIYNLRHNDNMNIISESVKRENRFGNTVIFSKYILMD